MIALPASTHSFDKTSFHPGDDDQWAEEFEREQQERAASITQVRQIEEESMARSAQDLHKELSSHTNEASAEFQARRAAREKELTQAVTTRERAWREQAAQAEAQRAASAAQRSAAREAQQSELAEQRRAARETYEKQKGDMQSVREAQTAAREAERAAMKKQHEQQLLKHEQERQARAADISATEQLEQLRQEAAAEAKAKQKISHDAQAERDDSDIKAPQDPVRSFLVFIAYLYLTSTHKSQDGISPCKQPSYLFGTARLFCTQVIYATRMCNVLPIFKMFSTGSGPTG